MIKDEIRPEDIRARTFKFAIRVLKLCKQLPKDEINRILINQVARSSTSIGANLEEAQGANTRPEFINCTNIAKKEARETHYWLLIIAEVNPQFNKRMQEIIEESEAIVKILTASIKKLRTRKDF